MRSVRVRTAFSSSSACPAAWLTLTPTLTLTLTLNLTRCGLQRPLSRLARPLHRVRARRGGGPAVQARRRRRRRGRLLRGHARWRPRHDWPWPAQGGAQARAVLVGRPAAEQRGSSGGGAVER